MSRRGEVWRYSTTEQLNIMKAIKLLTTFVLLGVITFSKAQTWSETSLELTSPGTSYTRTQLAEHIWSGSHGLLFNSYKSITVSGGLSTYGNTKYSNDVGPHGGGAGAIMFFGNGGVMSFYVSPASTGKDSNVAWGSPKMTIKRSGYIGISQSNPLSRLHVVAPVRESLRLYETNSADRYLNIWQGTGSPVIDAIGSGRLNIGWDEDLHLVINKGGTKGVSIGTQDLPNNYMLAVSGRVLSEEVKVQLKSAWPDYVFTPSYNLQSLSEVESFINENGHLPNIPSAAEVEENNGIELGAMNAKLLEKIEELTLHLIEKDKQLQTQEAELQTLNSKLKTQDSKLQTQDSKLQTLLERIEKLENQ